MNSFATVLERLATEQNPYPGLRPFETEDAHLFFGRDKQTAELVALVEQHRFVGVLGVSGGGKSSLVKAGLIPALERGHVRQTRKKWHIVSTHPGSDPFGNLSNALRESGLTVDSLRGSSMELAGVSAQLDDDTNLMVFVDQFEELFRYRETQLSTSMANTSASASQAVDYVQSLLEASRHYPPVYVVLTMRSDYLGYCAEFRDLPEALNRSQYLVPRLTRQEREEAIVGPLTKVEMAPNLVQRLLNDVGDEPEQLPILQHALMRTWDQWHKDEHHASRNITLQDYEAIGGFKDALNRHANQVLDSLDARIVETLFKRLTARGPSNRERRDPAKLKELWDLCGAAGDADRQKVTDTVEALRAPGTTFLSPRKGRLTAETDIDITHESLIRLWAKIRDEWLPQEQQASRTLVELTQRAAKRKSGGELLRGLDLADAVKWVGTRNETEVWATHYVTSAELDDALDLVRASKAVDLVRSNRLRLGLILAVVVAVASMVLTTYVLGLQRKAVENQKKAEDNEKKAEDNAKSVSQLLQTSKEQQEMLQKTLGDLQVSETNLIASNKTAEEANNAFIAAQARGLVGAFTAQAYAQQREGQPRTALLLAAEAFQRERTLETGGALQQLIAFVPRMVPTNTILKSGTRELIRSQVANAVLVLTDSSLTAVDWNTGRERWSRTDFGPAGSASMSSNDAHVLVTTLRTGSWLFDARSGKDLWKEPKAQGSSAVLTPDGRRAVILSDAEVAAYAIDTGREIFRVRPDLGRNRALAVSPDGLRLALASERGAALLDIGTGSVVLTFEGDERSSQRAPEGIGSQVLIAFHAKGVVSAGQDGVIRLFDTSSGRQLWKGMKGEEILTLGFSSDGFWLCSGGEDGTARVFQMENGVEVSRLNHGDFVNSVAFSPDNTLVATGSDDGWARVFERQTGKEVARVPHRDGEYVLAVTFSSDGRFLATGGDENTFNIVEITREQASRVSFDTEAEDFVGVNENATLVALMLGSNIIIREVRSGREVARFPLNSSPDLAIISPEGRWLAVLGERTTILSLPDGKRVAELPVAGMPMFSADGRVFALAGKPNVYETATGRVLLATGLPDSSLGEVDHPRELVGFSADGKRVAMVAGGAGDTSIGVFDLSLNRLVRRVQIGSKVTALTLSADGRLLAITTSGGVKVFDEAGAVVLDVPNRTENSILSFSPDASEIAFSAGGVVRIHSVRSKAQLWRLPVEGELFALSHEGDVVRITSAIEIGDRAELIVSRYVTAPDALLSAACARLPEDLSKDDWNRFAGPGVPYRATCAAWRSKGSARDR